MVVHMTYHKKFSCIRKNRHSSCVRNSPILTANGKGTVRNQKLLFGECADATINEVLYVLELRENLFSEVVANNKNSKT